MDESLIREKKKKKYKVKIFSIVILKSEKKDQFQILRLKKCVMGFETEFGFLSTTYLCEGFYNVGREKRTPTHASEWRKNKTII